MRRHVYFYTHVRQEYGEAAAVLVGDPARWLPRPGEPEDGGWRVTLRADGAVPERLAAHDATVTVGDASATEQRLLRAVSWASASSEGRFPVLAGDLGLDGLDGMGCHLSLMGTYRPPLSVVGGAADALVGHRVAEAVVRRFVLDVAERLVVEVKA